MSALFLAPGGSFAQPHPGFDQAKLNAAVERAQEMPRLKSLIVGRDGKIAFQITFRGPGLSTPTIIKSVSKSVLSALVGIAIDKGVLTSADQKIEPLMAQDISEKAGAPLPTVTVGNLLSMQSGLSRTSGRNYGHFVASKIGSGMS